MPNDVRYYGGQISCRQPEHGYRAGNDALLLAASLSGKNGLKCLELGCGSGIIMLLAAHHLPECTFTGVENHPDMLTLARSNTQSSKAISIEDADVGALPQNWHLSFDQVFANPPYFDDIAAVRMSKSKHPSFVTGRLDLAGWISGMLKMLKPRGVGTLIYRADGLEKVIAALFGKAGRIRILPVHSYADQPASRIIVQFRKGVKSESRLLPPLIMHERDSAARYTARAEQILCGELPINMGD